MRIRSFAFYGQNGSVFANFVADAFEDLADRDARSLIIDVRGNHGGSGLAAAFLLRRLASEPFSYWAPETDSGANDDLFEVQLPVETGFEGDVFLLVNADTFSAVPHFAALAKEHGMATLVGEPMGGGTSTNDAKRSHSSSNHGVNYRVATMRFDIDAPSIGMGASVQPEVLLEATVDDVLLGRDSQLRAAIALAS
ncbi:MAG: S41 family peptidase [Planctomycetota bacterium]